MRIFAWLTALLIVLHLIVLFGGRFVWGIPEPVGRMFFLDQEYNVPTFYTLILFLGCAYFCARYAYHYFTESRVLESVTWIFLTALLVFLGADEWLALHEKLIIPLREMFAIEQGPFYFAWTIPYIALVIAVGLLALPWLLRLNPQLRTWLIFSASIYIFGALGLEIYGSWVYSNEGFAYTEHYANIVTWEESLELIGLTMALSTLSAYLPRKKQTSEVSESVNTVAR